MELEESNSQEIAIDSKVQEAVQFIKAIDKNTVHRICSGQVNSTFKSLYNSFSA